MSTDSSQTIVNATREIMWNIPASFKVCMYVLFVISLIVFFYGLIRHYLFVFGRTPPWKLSELKKKLTGEESFSLNWIEFFRTIFLTGKVPRSPQVALFHGLIFYGFIILWIATDLVAIHYDTPFKIFQGTTYIIVSFAADIAGLMILIGLGLAYYRRYVKKENYLSATKPKRELFMYITLANLVVVGYLIEGIRIMGTGMPIGEKSWSPLGWSLATLFRSMSWEDSTWALSYRTLWFLHMMATMIFVASIPYTKFLHMFAIPFSALFQKNYRAATLNPMNFEDESRETFGLTHSGDLTAKNRLDLLSCVECGRCSQVCPAKNADKPLDPKLIITKIRDAIERQTPSSPFEVLGLSAPWAYNSEKNIPFWENSPIFSSSEIDACTTCGACMEECPAHIEHVPLIMEAKRYKALTLGDIPPSAADAIMKIKNNGNPWGISQDDRMKWAEGLEVPIIEEGQSIDYLYYVGCAGSYDASNQKVVQDTVMLLKKAGVHFAVMGKTEKCNGDPVRRFGDEYSFFEIAIENIANMRKYNFKKVVTHCPHCLHTIGKEYAKFENGSFETIHHTELLADLIKTKKLVPQKPLSESVTFHDPCYLGRHHGEYNAPREILKSIKGLELVEMPRSKDKALCCGMGGGNMWYELPEGVHLAQKRLEEVGESQAKKLASACSFCMINFQSSKGQVKATENLEIKDVATYLKESLET